MKKALLLLMAVLLGCLSVTAQRYVVNGKKGKIRVVEYEKVDGQWTCANKADIYIDNGYEFEAVPPVSEDQIVMEYDGKYYRVVFPEKELQLVDDMGKDSHLGFRNFMRNTFVGHFYKTSIPGLLGLACALIALVAFGIGIFKEEVPVFLRWGYAGGMCIVSILELGALLSIGIEAYWWVTPDDVGYLIAIVMLFPFSLTVAMQIYAFKLYKFMGEVPGNANIFIKILLGIGCVTAVIAAIQVVFNFIFSFFCLALMIWMGGQKTYSKDSSGNIYENSMFGSSKIDKSDLKH